MLKILKNKKNNTFIVSERQYIGIIATINSFRSTLASCEVLLELDFVRSIVKVLGPDCADAIRTTIVGNAISGEAGTLLRTLSERPLASVLSLFHGGTGDVGGLCVLGEINYPLPRPDHLIRVKIRIKCLTIRK